MGSRKAGTAVRVLLIGSYPPLVSALRRGLEEEGFTVEVACPGAPPVGDECDVVLLDLKSSGDPALPAVEHWRRCGLRAPVLALGPPGGPGALTRAVDDWLAKPFDLDELLSRLHALACGI